jgi:hypothetical protein
MSAVATLPDGLMSCASQCTSGYDVEYLYQYREYLYCRLEDFHNN